MNLITRPIWLLAAEEGFSNLGLGVYIAITLLVIIGFLSVANKGLNSRFFQKRETKILEQLYVFIEGLAVGIIGPHGRRYMPILMFFWLMIFVGNFLALILHASPTADISFNLGMALFAVGYVQYEGIRSNGFYGHFRHFGGPKLPWFMFLITLMIFMIEIISETMKNVSLSLRLYGNIHGGHEAVLKMNELGQGYFPVGDLLLPIKMLTVVVQALIFCLLFAVYLSLVTHHEEDHDHEHEAEVAPAH